ncbi:hypothetical protein DERP_003609 [Dermatophagoides pteronyssinus]|uniref:Uncharacterized protein n=1 Tax=Dermatophagoides pteronyssinus TaxID=6956 RepID=A0ABQ8JL43_DERPT|nr:hypothetical protein DERP_003609 [Dermatophagoides pteronyssinus]
MFASLGGDSRQERFNRFNFETGSSRDPLNDIFDVERINFYLLPLIFNFPDMNAFVGLILPIAICINVSSSVIICTSNESGALFNDSIFNGRVECESNKYVRPDTMKTKTALISSLILSVIFDFA